MSLSSANLWRLGILSLWLAGGLPGPGLQAALPEETEAVVPFKILHTGNTQGALEVCGCAMGLQGGVAARAHIIQQERQGAERFLLLDAGGFFSGTESIDRDRVELYLQTMVLMGYDAVLISEAEFCLGADFLIEQLELGQLPAVATNLTAPQDTPQPWEPILYFEFPRLRIALIGLLPEESTRIPAPYALSDPVEAASRAVGRIGDTAEMIIALSALDLDEERQLLKEVPDIDLLLSSRMAMAFRKYFGTLAAHSSEGGKTLNLVEASFYPAAEQFPFSFRPRTRQVVPKQGEDPIIRQVVDNFYESVRRQALEEDAELRLFTQEAVESLPGNAFLGNTACKECHPMESTHWQQSPHARSLLSLLNEYRHYVPQCLKCHTTGYGYPSGLNLFDEDSPLAQVGCESCHGPGKLHIQEPTRKDAIRREVPDAHCKVCHDAENDPQFDSLVDIRRRSVQHIDLTGITGNMRP